MGQLARRARLEFETLDGLGIGAEEFVEHLERHDFVQRQVARLIDNAHRAAIDFLDDLESAVELRRIVAQRRDARAGAIPP